MPSETHPPRWRSPKRSLSFVPRGSTRFANDDRRRLDAEAEDVDARLIADPTVLHKTGGFVSPIPPLSRSSRPGSSRLGEELGASAPLAFDRSCCPFCNWSELIKRTSSTDDSGILAVTRTLGPDVIVVAGVESRSVTETDGELTTASESLAIPPRVGALLCTGRAAGGFSIEGGSRSFKKAGAGDADWDEFDFELSTERSEELYASRGGIDGGSD